MAVTAAVFLDKDGTLVENVPYNIDPERIRLMPGALAGLARLHAAGFRLFVVSNQSGVARGYFDERALAVVEGRLRALLAPAGVPLAGMYCCPHHLEGSVVAYATACDCRKPAPGLLLRAAAAHGIDLSRSWLAGDILDDVEAGRRAGCRTILVASGGETEWRLSPERMPHYLAPDLALAARIITGHRPSPLGPLSQPRERGHAQHDRRPSSSIRRPVLIGGTDARAGVSGAWGGSRPRIGARP